MFIWTVGVCNIGMGSLYASFFSGAPCLVVAYRLFRVLPTVLLIMGAARLSPSGVLAYLKGGKLFHTLIKAIANRKSLPYSS